MVANTVVIGVGNPLCGDDAAGRAVVRTIPAPESALVAIAPYFPHVTKRPFEVFREALRIEYGRSKNALA